MARWNAYPWTPEQDAAIRRAYERGERCGNRNLARQWQIAPRQISARAAVLGLPPLIAIGPRGPQERWRATEIALVRAHSGEPTAQIRARLYAKGCSRSLAAVRRAVARLREDGAAPDRETFYELRNRLTTTAVAAGLGVSKYMVDEWIKKGWLKTRQAAPGTVHTVHYRDLRRFLIDYVACWDHRKADRWFLVDVLTNHLAESGECREAA